MNGSTFPAGIRTQDYGSLKLRYLKNKLQVTQIDRLYKTPGN